jgi:hypothetical protein
MASCVLAALRRQRVVLHADEIEVVGVFTTRRLAYSDIGAKMPVAGYWPTWALLASESSKRRVMFEMAYNFDQAFRDWFDKIPRADNAFWQGRRATR